MRDHYSNSLIGAEYLDEYFGHFPVSCAVVLVNSAFFMILEAYNFIWISTIRSADRSLKAHAVRLEIIV